MDKDELWQKTLALLLEGTTETDLKSVFLNRLTPLGVFGDQFILLAQDAQVESWVRSNYLPEMNEKAALASGRQLNVDLAVAQAPAAPAQAQPSQQAQPSPQPAQQQAAPLQTPASAAPQAQTMPQPQAQAQVQQPEWMNTYISPAEAQQTAREQALQQPEWMNAYLTPDNAPAATSAPAANRPGAEEIVRHGNGQTTSGQSGEEGLFAKCTFDTFVVGKSNEFARGAALAVAEKPGIAYNPLFIYGNSGLGKTHLLVAIANYVLQNWPSMVTRYVSANRFMNDYVEAVQTNSWSSFNKNYHSVDVLLVDDVQYLEGAEGTINQLFNIFNEMTNQNKQVVLAADRAPKDIDMDERYRSRFMSGLLADIKPPDYETRLAIMRNYLSRVNAQAIGGSSFDIPDDVLDWLASVATSNIREMEGAITRLVGNMGFLHKSSITVEEAQELLQDFFPSLTNKQIDVATIQSEVEHYFGITHEQMIGKTRAKGVTTPRHIAIYLSRYLTEESLESIGKKFGGRDHTTVMHSVNKIEREQKDDRKLFEQIDQLTIRIKERG